MEDGAFRASLCNPDLSPCGFHGRNFNVFELDRLGLKFMRRISIREFYEQSYIAREIYGICAIMPVVIVCKYICQPMEFLWTIDGLEQASNLTDRHF